jgi:tetratricopeptide (TPR) repeat protein
MIKSLLFFLIYTPFLFSQSNFEKGEKLYAQNKFPEAKINFEHYLESFPSDTKTIEYLGDLCGREKDWDNAIKYYEKIKKQHPQNANYHYKYGGALGMKAKESNKFAALGMIEDVEDAFLTAAKLDSKHVDTRWALVMFYIEIPAIIGGSEKKAQKYADELMALSKVDGYLAKGYIDVYFKRYKNAEIYYKNAHIVGNSNTTFEKLYDLYLNKMKDKAKAIKLKEQFEK